jgi:hypothetical protein
MYYIDNSTFPNTVQYTSPTVNNVESLASNIFNISFQHNIEWGGGGAIIEKKWVWNLKPFQFTISQFSSPTLNPLPLTAPPWREIQNPMTNHS